MNKRQKKKLYKRKMGKNPPKEMKFFEKNYHEVISKPQNKKNSKVYSWDSPATNIKRLERI